MTTTENFVLCAAAAQGESTLTNAASEPHVQEFCRFMAMMGADIDGIGTSRLAVRGGAALKGGEFTFEEDFHEITTFLALGAITGGDVVVRNSTPGNFPLIDRTFAKFGVRIEHKDGWSRAFRDGPLKVQTPFTSNVLTKVEAAPWPYFPVDLLPIFIALGVCAEGNAMFWNKVYDGALGWTGELSSSAPTYSRRTRTASSPSAAMPSRLPWSRAPTSSAWPSRCSWWPAASRAAPRSATPRRSAAPIRASSRTCAAWACRWSGPTRNEDRRGPGAYFASAPQALRVSMPRATA